MKQEFMENGYAITPNLFFAFLRQKKINIHQLVILTYILNTQKSYATQSNIVKVLNLNNRIVKQNLEELVKKGFLQYAKDGFKTFYQLESFNNIKKMID